MNQNICYNCGGKFEERGGRLVCCYCGTVKPENVSGEELQSRYENRITSRLLGEYELLLFSGNDIRMQKL